MTDASPLHIRSAAALLDAVPAAPSFILDPILAPGTTALIYGDAGVGKSFLELGLALAAAGGGRFHGRTAPRPRRVLYLDGEMSVGALAGRLRLFGTPPPSLDVWLASEQPGLRLDLSTWEGLSCLAGNWKAVDLVIIDSLSSLAGVLPEGDPERWTEMRHFLGMVQRYGRAVVMVHHANRQGAVRGDIRRFDAMDLVLALRRPADWRPADGARFELRLEKARLQSGDALAPIEAQLRTGPDGLAHWQWHRGDSVVLCRATSLLQQGMSAEAVAKAIGVSARTAYRLQRRAREAGWLGRAEGGPR